jgi:hypothetical protein
MTSMRVITCADQPLPGGGWAHITSLHFTGSGVDPDDRGKIRNAISILRPDGVQIQAVACDGPCEALGPRPTVPHRPHDPSAPHDRERPAVEPPMEKDFVDDAASI